jgi:hypothetical protein
MEVPLAPSGGVEVIGMSKRFGGKAVLPPLLAVGAGLVGNRVSAPTAAPKVSLDQSLPSRRKEGWYHSGRRAMKWSYRRRRQRARRGSKPTRQRDRRCHCPRWACAAPSCLPRKRRHGGRKVQSHHQSSACAITFASAIPNAHASHNTLLAWMAYHGRPGSGACGSGQLKV